ncbi:MAG: hypothetical protein FWF44_00250 [Defluviitaleaceae bacterium]|nr:hypothetical protein [Defluviitaleaceae bacterium]
MTRIVKPLILLGLLSILALCLAACGGSGNTDANGDTPSQAVDKALAFYKAQDYANFNAALTDDTVKNFNPDKTEFDAATLQAFSQIDYTIESETVSGSTATVTASITAIDIKQAVSDTVTYSFNMQTNGTWDSSDPDKVQQEYEDYYHQYILDPSRAKITKDVQIQLQKVGGVWKIVPGTDFQDALTGYQSGTGTVGGN